jgi:simple sugar transport system ATP-binding protein
MDPESSVILRMEGISKRFPGVLANDDIHLDIRKGEVRGLLGENGAGKTTLMNILYGLHQPDAGEILISDRRVKIDSPRVAVDLGIGMVHQHFMLVENMTALENVLLVLPSRRPPWLDVGGARSRFDKIVQEHGLQIRPSNLVWQMPVVDQQWLEILKLLILDVQLIILDEPTAVLAPSQIQRLFDAIRRFAVQGKSIIFISHKLAEVKEITDRVTVLRDGRVVRTVETQFATTAELAQMMIGRSVTLERKPRAEMGSRKEALSVRGLHCNDDRGVEALKGVDLTIHSGEIVGVAGVAGNGQGELADCIAGLREATRGKITIGGSSVRGVFRDPRLLGYIPEDRRKTGLVVDFSVADNLILRKYRMPPFNRKGFLQWDAIQREAQRLIARLHIRTPDVNVLVRNLSGGNQQKIIVSRELDLQPQLILASQPTRGLDLASVESVHRTLLEERNRGAGVLFISAELSEVLALSDRIVVFFKGEIMGEVRGEGADVQAVGRMMIGERSVAPAANPAAVGSDA